MNTLWSLAEGFASGAALVDMKRVEDSVRQGQNHALTGVHQAAQSWEILDQVERVLKAASYTPLGIPVRCVLAASPLLLAYAAANQWGGPNLYLIYDHIGTLCHVASLASSVALVYFGQIAFGAVSLTLIGIGFLDRNGILPPDIRRVVHITTYPLLLVTGLIVGGPFTKIFVISNFATMIFQAAISPQAPAETIAPQTTGVNLNQLNDLTFQPLDSNPLHLRYSPLPPIPDVNIQTLNALCNAIDWRADSHQRALQSKLGRDARWRDRYQGQMAPDVYLKRQLRAIVDSVQNRTILEGEPVNYDELHNYLKIIADRLPGLDEFSRADILLKIAIDGGEYCGPGKFNAVSDSYLSVLSEGSSDLPLEKKILIHLQQQRIRIMQNLYAEFEGATRINQALAGVMDHLDLHNYNIFLNLFCSEFGLPNQGAAEDAAAHVDPVLLAAASQVNIRGYFQENYTSGFISSSVQEAIGTPALPLPEIYEWWRTWVGRQNIPEAEKEILLEELSRGELAGEPVENTDYHWTGEALVSRTSVSKHLIKAMLLEMGILKYPGPEPEPVPEN